MNRRSFLKLTGMAAAGAPTAIDSAAAQTHPRIKIGFLGATHSHAREKIRIVSNSPEFELVGICESDANARRNYEALGARFLSQEELLSSVEAVAVESGVKDHARHAKAALAAGKHVHLEKPPAADLPSFRELVALAKDKQVLLQMGYMWRYHPGINEVLRAAREGWLGEVYLVRGTIDTSLGAAQRRDGAQFHGGTMFELGSHLIDPLIRLLGAPHKVTPFLKQHGKFDDKLADNTVAVFEFPRALGIISSATVQPISGTQRLFEVLGTNGTALVKPIEPPHLQIHLSKEAGPYKAGAQTIDMPPFRRYAADFAELTEAILKKTPLAVTHQENLLVHEALLRACDMPLD